MWCCWGEDRHGGERVSLPAGHGLPVVRDVEVLGEVVGAADEGQLDAEVIEQQHLEALPLFLPRLRFILKRTREGKAENDDSAVGSLLSTGFCVGLKGSGRRSKFRGVVKY